MIPQKLGQIAYKTKKIPTFTLRCFQQFEPFFLRMKLMLQEFKKKCLCVSVLPLICWRKARRHKARPKESLKAISTGTSATESWKHT